MWPDGFDKKSPGILKAITISEIDPLTMKSLTVSTKAYVPGPLPNQLDLNVDLQLRLENAAQALGTLDGLGGLLQNPHVLIRPFLRREAVASSRIEGTVADLRQLLLFEEEENTASPSSDVGEVRNYVRALEFGLDRPPGRAISSSLLREMHSILMRDVRDGDRRPGYFRQGQVYIGQPGAGLAKARFVPPPPEEVTGLILDLERWIGGEIKLPKLVRLAMIHYQFEAIHPFEDGNGRIGRLMIPLLMQDWGLLSKPLLYLSDYFESNRAEYYDGLLAVSKAGDWEQWVALVLEAIRYQATDAVERGQRLLELREEYRRRYQGSPPARALEVIDLLFESPAITVKHLQNRLEIAYSSANNVVTLLQENGLLVEATGRKRNRVYIAPEIIGILEGL